MDSPARPAFGLLVPTCPEYATLPVAEAFTWASIAGPTARGDWYLVCFRSVRRPGADEMLLTSLDDRAHDAAASTEGFVHYFKGPVNERGECLSFCIWETQRAARAASGLPAHVVAASIVHEAYASWTLELYRLLKRRGRAGFRFEAWQSHASRAEVAGPAPRTSGRSPASATVTATATAS